MGLEEAEDLAQEVFVVACRSASTSESTRAWLYGIASNLARAWWRGKGRRQGANLRLAAQPSSDGEESASVLDRLDASSAAGQLRTMLEGLPPAQQEALLLAAAGLNPAEIAAALGVSPLAVRSRLLRARRQLRPHLAPLDVPGRLDNRTHVQQLTAAAKAHFYDITHVTSETISSGGEVLLRTQVWHGYVNGQYGQCSDLTDSSPARVNPQAQCDRPIPGDPGRSQIELYNLANNTYAMGSEPTPEPLFGGPHLTSDGYAAELRQEQASGMLNSAGRTSVDGRQAIRLVATGPGRPTTYLVDLNSYLVVEAITPPDPLGRPLQRQVPGLVRHYQYLAPTAANAALLWQPPPKGATRLAFTPCSTAQQCEASIASFQDMAYKGLNVRRRGAQQPPLGHR